MREGSADMDCERMIRLALSELVLTVAARARRAEATVVWSGGGTARHEVRCPRPGLAQAHRRCGGRAPARAGAGAPRPQGHGAARRRGPAYPDGQGVDLRTGA